MSFLRSVSELRPGDHACLVYDSLGSRDEHLACFLGRGLADGDRLIYIDDGTDGRVAAGLAEKARPGQLTVLPAEDTYLAGGGFDPEQVVEGFRSAVEASLAMGFRAVRSAGGPPATVTGNGHSHRLSHYERRANELFAAGTLSAVCAYDVRRTQPTALLGIVDAHPIVVYAVGSDERLQVETPSRSQLALRGWVDVTTLGGLVPSVSDAVAAGDDVEIDLRLVDFVDVGGWRLFAEAADRLHERGRTLRIIAAPRWAPSVLEILGYNDREGLVLL